MGLNTVLFLDMVFLHTLISFMAPEVVRGLRYTEKCDVYSFAMVMFSLFFVFLCIIGRAEVG